MDDLGCQLLSSEAKSQYLRQPSRKIFSFDGLVKTGDLSCDLWSELTSISLNPVPSAYPKEIVDNKDGIPYVEGNDLHQDV